MTYLDVPVTLIMEFAEKYGSGVDELLATVISAMRQLLVPM